MKAILISLLLSVVPVTLAVAQHSDHQMKKEATKGCCAKKSTAECTMDKQESTASTTNTNNGVQPAAAGTQEATIVVKDGYNPQTIRVKKGIPVRLNFDLQKKGCMSTVVLKDFEIEQKLALGKSTAVEFTPTKAGTFAFTCAMGMGDGKLIVEE